MGTILRYANFRVEIIPGDHKPAHVHIIGPDFIAKVSLDDCECYYARGLNQKSILVIEKFVTKNKDFLIQAWGDINEK